MQDGGFRPALLYWRYGRKYEDDFPCWIAPVLVRPLWFLGLLLDRRCSPGSCSVDRIGWYSHGGYWVQNGETRWVAGLAGWKGRL